MECCASMPCTPANHGHDCCKNSVTIPSVYVVPSAATPTAPLLAVVGNAPLLAIVRPAAPAESADASFDASAHAPPLELYTAYHSLLI